MSSHSLRGLAAATLAFVCAGAALGWALLREEDQVRAAEDATLLAFEGEGSRRELEPLSAGARPQTEHLARRGESAPLVAAWSEPARPSREELLRGAVPALRGRVIEVGGEAIPRAEIRVLLEDGEVDFVADAAGSFALELPPAPSIALEVRAEGFLPARYGALPFEGERELALDPALALRGRAIDGGSGEALEGVEVTAQRVASVNGVPRTSPPARSSRAGTFVIEGLGPGDFELRATAPGYAPLRLERVSLRRGQDEELPLALQPALGLLVRVRDEAGEALPGAEILVRQDADGARPRVVLEGTSDAAGMARFTGLAVGPVRVVARSAERAAERVELELARPAAGSAAELPLAELTLTRGLAAVGIVRDAEGRAASGVQVVALEGRRRWPRFDAPEEEELAARTGPDGSFRIQGLRPGTWRLCAFDVELAFGQREIALAPDAAKRPPKAIEIALLPPYGVRGVILDASGSPVADAAIEVAPEGARDALGEVRSARSDARGTFELGRFPRGAMELRVEAPGHRDERRVVAPPQQAALTEVRIALRGAHGVRGRVVDVLGRAVGPARIELVEELSGRGEKRRPHAFRGRSDAYGDFFIQDVLPGVYAVRVQSFGHQPLPIDRAQIVLPGDEEVTLTLELLERAPTGTLVGLVRSGTTGAPPESYRVDGIGLRGGSVSYGAAGRFEWTGIEAGTGGVEVQSPRHARRFFPTVEVWSGGRVDLGVVMLELGADLVVATRLNAVDRDEARKLAVERELRIELSPLDPLLTERGARTLAATGRDGRVRIEGLLPGKWRVTVRGGSGWFGQRVLDLAEGENASSVELLAPRELARRREAERLAERRKRAEEERAKRAAAEASKRAAAEAAKRAAAEGARRR